MNLLEKYLPDWLEKRSDFNKACKEMKIQAKEAVPRACAKP